MQAYDGQLVHVSLENRYQQLHVDTGTITPGPNGTVEVDVPLANLPGVDDRLDAAAARRLRRTSARARSPGRSSRSTPAGPTDDYVLGALLR